MVDKRKALAILDELEAEYLRLGTTLCNKLTDESQLSAFLLLGLRSTSLLKSVLLLIQPTTALAGCDAVERAFLEASHLQLEFRFLDSKKKVDEWFASKSDSWKSDKGKLNSFFQAQRGTGFGREYGDFSVSTHPTVDACRSSVAIVTSARGINAKPQQLQQAVEVRSGNYANMLFREIWTAFADEQRLMRIPIERSNVPLCVTFVDEFIKFLEGEMQKAVSAEP
jgi:hypothetical protein